MRTLIYAFIWHLHQWFCSSFFAHNTMLQYIRTYYMFATDLRSVGRKYFAKYRWLCVRFVKSLGGCYRCCQSLAMYIFFADTTTTAAVVAVTILICESTCTRTMDKVFDMYFSIVITAISLWDKSNRVCVCAGPFGLSHIWFPYAQIVMLFNTCTLCLFGNYFDFEFIRRLCALPLVCFCMVCACVCVFVQSVKF